MYMLEKVTSKAGMFLDIEIPLQKPLGSIWFAPTLTIQA